MTTRKADKKSSPKANPPSSNPMWGGQYAQGPAEIMAEINASIGFDGRLYAQDIRGSIAHAEMLAKAGILTKRESALIISGLKEIKQEIEAGKFVFKVELEDIHMNIEARLAEIIGETAGKLHTARSRNDQVALDFRMFVRDALQEMDIELTQLQAALIRRADENATAIMPGFTHLQSAQPVTLGHHLMAYVEMFGRDRRRIQAALENLNECPLGAAALAGTSFPIDRQMTAKALGFAAPTANSLDSVSDRDFAMEFLSVASISAIHLSRLAEEFVLWTSAQFHFVKFSDLFTSGSSIMPQKRNPDAAELVRGKTGRIIGALNSLLVTMKGLPLSYNKDMQEDKEPLFDAFDQWRLCVGAMAGMVSDFIADLPHMHESAEEGYSTATDLADWLVRMLGLPFRNAHHVTARIVKLATDNNCMLAQLSIEDMKRIEPGITQDIYSVLTVKRSVSSRTSFGGTSPVNVKEAVKAAKKKYL